LTRKIGVPIIGAMDIVYTLSELFKAGLTQTQIGEAIGVKQPTVCEMAKGKAGVKRPSSQVVIGLSNLAEKHNVRTEPDPGTKIPGKELRLPIGVAGAAR
jgi:predicted XRE-type DNA-binding protein